MFRNKSEKTEREVMAFQVIMVTNKSNKVKQLLLAIWLYHIHGSIFLTSSAYNYYRINIFSDSSIYNHPGAEEHPVF